MPSFTSVRTASGVSATRRSPGVVSVGTPILTRAANYTEPAPSWRQPEPASPPFGRVSIHIAERATRDRGVCRVPPSYRLLLRPSASPAAAPPAAAAPSADVRFATFNASLNRSAAGQLVERPVQPAATTSAVARRATSPRSSSAPDPDVLLINEFDFDADGRRRDLFRDNFLAVSQNGAPADRLPVLLHRAVEHRHPVGLRPRQQRGTDRRPATTRSASASSPASSAWWSSRSTRSTRRRAHVPELPVEGHAGRPAARRPGHAEPADWYSPEELDVFRLSSKSHWDVPIQVGGKTVHFLVSHPTPPVFDGPEDRNGTRNHDEIRFWADYVTPGQRRRTSTTTTGRRGGLAAGALVRDRRRPELRPARRRQRSRRAIQQLLEHPRVNTRSAPTSAGGDGGRRRCRAARTRPTAATRGSTPPTSPTPRRATCAPTTCCRAGTSGSSDSGVFWPVHADPLFRLTGVFDRTGADRSAASRRPTTGWSGPTSTCRRTALTCERSSRSPEARCLASTAAT